MKVEEAIKLTEEAGFKVKRSKATGQGRNNYEILLPYGPGKRPKYRLLCTLKGTELVKWVNDHGRR